MLEYSCCILIELTRLRSMWTGMRLNKKSQLCSLFYPETRLLKINPQSKEGLILKGWMEVAILRESKSKNALQYFEAVLKTNNRNIEAIFGKSKYYELCGHFDESIELLNQLIVVYQNFSPPLVEKMKVQLCLQDWDQADETANRFILVFESNI